jgi:hypothetical protein
VFQEYSKLIGKGNKRNILPVSRKQPQKLRQQLGALSGT